MKHRSHFYPTWRSGDTCLKIHTKYECEHSLFYSLHPYQRHRKSGVSWEKKRHFWIALQLLLSLCFQVTIVRVSACRYRGSEQDTHTQQDELQTHVITMENISDHSVWMTMSIISSCEFTVMIIPNDEHFNCSYILLW